MNLGISTYSFWHFEEKKLPLKEYLVKAYEHGFNGVEVLSNHIESRSEDYLKEIKRFAFKLGLDVYGLAIHNNFVKVDKDERMREVELVKDWIRLGSVLGVKIIRINSGRWMTVRSFDELMERRGIEPPPPGYSDEDAIEWVVECINECLEEAEKHGIILGLENHWGLTTRAGNMLKIIKKISSDYFGAIMDTGNFIHDTYRELEAIAPYTVMVHAKTYFGGGVWYTLDLDYDRIFEILRGVNFRGWVSLEYEGREAYDEGVRKSKELLLKYIKRLS